MVKRVLLLGLAGVLVFSLSGCATTRKNNELEIQGLRNKVSALETQVNEKDNEINSLRESMAKGSAETSKSEKSIDLRHQANGKQIQTALKNAGFYQGAIDGNMGKKTRRAIKEFQKANNLPVDGKVGKKTWLALKDYLGKKVK